MPSSDDDHRDSAGRLVVTDASGWQPALEVVCACGHLAANHDRIAKRYCAATAAGQLDRGCVCQSVHDLAGAFY